MKDDITNTDSMHDEEIMKEFYNIVDIDNFDNLNLISIADYWIPCGNGCYRLSGNFTCGYCPGKH